MSMQSTASWEAASDSRSALAIEGSGLLKAFGKTRAVDGVDHDVAEQVDVEGVAGAAAGQVQVGRQLVHDVVPALKRRAGAQWA